MQTADAVARLATDAVHGRAWVPPCVGEVAAVRDAIQESQVWRAALQTSSPEVRAEATRLLCPLAGALFEYTRPRDHLVAEKIRLAAPSRR